MKGIKVAFLYFENLNQEYMGRMMDDIGKLGKKHGYEFIITNTKLDSIPKKEILATLHNLEASKK